MARWGKKIIDDGRTVADGAMKLVEKGKAAFTED
jgi:hypothetical protein